MSVFSLSASFLSACSLSDFSFTSVSVFLYVVASVASFSATVVASILDSSLTSAFSSAFTASIFNSGSSSTTGVDKVEPETFLSEFDSSEVAGFTEGVVSSARTPLAPKKSAVPKRTLAAPKLYLRIEKR